MLRMMRSLHDEERGVALIMAIMVAFVVLLLSIYVLDQATHNQQQAAYDRDRLTAANASEAGIDWWFNKLQNIQAADLPLTAYTGSVISGPNSVSFTATPTYYSDAGGTTAFSGTPSDNNYPKSVKVVSVGTASDGTSRTMQTFMALHPVYGGFEGALIADANTTIKNNVSVSGDSGNDGDILILNGDYNAPAGNQTVKGNIYVATPGHTLTIGTSMHVYGSVWATGSVSIAHNQAIVDQDAKSTSGGVSVTKGTVGGKAYYCTGAAPPNPPGSVSGGTIQTCALGNPPSTSFPQVIFNQTEWENEGYWVKTFSGGTACSDAQSYVESSASSTVGKYSIDAPLHPGGIVVRIASNCTYTNSGNVTLSIPTSLAIVTDGGINLTQHTTWNGVSGTQSLFFIHSWPSSGTYSCALDNPNGTYDLGDVYVGQLTSFDTHVQVSVYTPCEAVMLNNNSAFQGQVIGGTMTVGNLFTMNYRPVLIPGAHVSGFQEDVAYIREVAS